MSTDAAATDPAAGPRPDADRQRLIARVNVLYHDLQSTAFDAVHQRRHRVERIFWVRRAVPRLRAAAARVGVDLGTGTGFVPRALLPELGEGAEILCIDVSENALRQAAASVRGLPGTVRFHAGSAESIPAEDASVDWVSMNAVLHHMPDVPAVFREIDRVLKPGGRFCLGHEPNAAFFGSRALHGMERLIWRAFWYGSPRRNWGRLRRKLGKRVETYESHEHLDAINQALRAEGLIDRPLGLAELRQLVDVHTHDGDGPEDKAGFDAPGLIREHFPTYEAEVLRFADYGGEMLRGRLWLRGGFDAAMNALAPRKGRLFSWVLRKPG